MGPDIASPTVEPADLQLGWSRGLSLTTRILAVNLFVLALLGAGLFFLDSYRVRLIAERDQTARNQATFLARSLPLVAQENRAAYVIQFGQQNQSRPQSRRDQRWCHAAPVPANSAPTNTPNQIPVRC